MDLLEKVLSRHEFLSDPPVLLDIGASGEVNPKWKKIAKFSICIAFDADDREFSYVINESSKFKQLYTYHSIVTDQKSSELDFYLTHSPYCSSLLEPDSASLQNWSFAELFEVKEKIKLKATDLKTALNTLGIEKVDWFKADSQGIDLRLFENLKPEVINKILIAEFEPGIIDAYQGEDKLFHLMAYMQGKPFWMSNIVVRGSQRINQLALETYLSQFEKKHIDLLIKSSPGWGEVTYLNSFRQDSFSKRDFLLGWVFSMIEEQYGFALELLDQASQKFDDSIFDELKRFTIAQIKSNYYKIGFFFISKIINKLGRLFGK